MKYKVTTRGWVVLGVMLILVLVLIVSLFSNNENDNKLPVEDTTIVENTGNDLENNDSNNEVDSNDLDSGDHNSNEESEVTETSNEDMINDSSEELNVESDKEVIIDSDEEANNEISEEVISNSDEEATSDINNESGEARHYNYDSYGLTIHYGKNISELNSKYFDYLREIKLMLDSDSKKQIVIEGHINGYPYYKDGEYGLNISLMRANAVRVYLMNIGVSEDDIVIVNKGSSDQIDMSGDVKNHYLNRRAYIIFENKEN